MKDILSSTKYCLNVNIVFYITPSGPSNCDFKMHTKWNAFLPSVIYVLEKPCFPHTCVEVIITLPN